jgi:hypothetical protein
MSPRFKRPMSSEHEAMLVRPNPPTPEMVAAAQPFRADVVGASQLIELAKRSVMLAK